MNVGTKSLLFGVHQFLWHPITVIRAWRALYRAWPSPRTLSCIVMHDWGYWGSADMDGKEGHVHPVRSARIVDFIHGDDWARLVLLHSRHYAKTLNLPPSRLCWADKFSMLYDPEWFYLLRARLSGEIREYRQNAAKAGFVPLHATDREWLRKLKAKLSAMALNAAQEGVS